jgi:hypothetical protein
MYSFGKNHDRYLLEKNGWWDLSRDVLLVKPSHTRRDRGPRLTAGIACLTSPRPQRVGSPCSPKMKCATTSRTRLHIPSMVLGEATMEPGKVSGAILVRRKCSTASRTSERTVASEELHRPATLPGCLLFTRSDLGDYDWHHR